MCYIVAISSFRVFLPVRSKLIAVRNYIGEGLINDRIASFFLRADPFKN